MLVQMPAVMFGNSIHLRNAALVRSNSHLAKEIIAARQENAKMKKEVAHKDFTDEDVCAVTELNVASAFCRFPFHPGSLSMEVGGVELITQATV